MSPNPEGPFEIAMTHLQTGEGRKLCVRPDAIVALARRVNSWRDDPVACQSCSHADARYMRQGLPLCASCRDHRIDREGGVEYRKVDTREWRSGPVGGDGLQGYAIVFDMWSVDLGGFRERIRPAAINRTVEENIDVRVLWNHNTDLPIGRMSANTMTARADKTGYFVKVVPPAWAASHIETVDRRDVQGQSFGFRAVDDEWNFDGPIPLRDVLDMRVSETSFVAFPAYPDTTARAVKDLTLARAAIEAAKRSARLRLAV